MSYLFAFIFVNFTPSKLWVARSNRAGITELIDGLQFHCNPFFMNTRTIFTRFSDSSFFSKNGLFRPDVRFGNVAPRGTLRAMQCWKSIRNPDIQVCRPVFYWILGIVVSLRAL